MKSINSALLYILLAIALCSPNVSTLCGNDEQIEEIRSELITQESIYTALTTLSAFPVTGATLAFAQIMMSTRFALNLQDKLEEMESTLDKDHRYYQPCIDSLKTTITSTMFIKSANYGLSLSTMVPGVGLAFLVPRLITSISNMLLIREQLEFWREFGCQNATTRDCNI